MTLTINKLKLNSPFVLAPLAGITDGPFRRICFEMGASLAYSEMVSAKGLYYKSANTEELLKILPGEGPVGYQLFGHEPEIMAWAVKKLEDYPNVLIDINMGCPVPKVVKNFEGSALLNNPELAEKCVRACVENTKKPVSIKMRIGFTDDKCAVDFAKRMEAAGASMIAVHGRTREQYYSGKANWQKIKEIKEAVSIPVTGNGDVFSYEDAERMINETGVDAVMIARGAIGNPWIFEGRKPELDEIKSTMLRHAEMLVLDKGEYAGMRQMRSHASHYIKGIKGAAMLRARINACDHIEDLEAILKEI